MPAGSVARAAVKDPVPTTMDHPCRLAGVTALTMVSSFKSSCAHPAAVTPTAWLDPRHPLRPTVLQVPGQVTKRHFPLLSQMFLTPAWFWKILVWGTETRLRKAIILLFVIYPVINDNRRGRRDYWWNHPSSNWFQQRPGDLPPPSA